MTGDRVTLDELCEMFGAELPLDVWEMLAKPRAGRSMDDVRAELRKMAERERGKKSWDEFNRSIALREDDYDEICAKIVSENYYAKDAVSITMSTSEWDMAQRLIMLGWQALQKYGR